jgi:hypothetical protein
MGVHGGRGDSEEGRETRARAGAAAGVAGRGPELTPQACPTASRRTDPLTAQASRDDIQLATPFSSEGGTANTLVFRPTRSSFALGEASVALSEPGFAPLEQPMRLTPREANVTCR